MASESVSHIAVPGTFDPITYGHLDVIRRAARICPRVTVAVAASRGKNGTGTAFTLDERVEMVRGAIAEAGIEGEIRVEPLTGLLVDFCRERGAAAVVKGLRAATDFEYELQQADLNARLSPELESIFVMASPEFGYVSSSAVRELASFDADVSALVPPSIAARLKERFSK